MKPSPLHPDTLRRSTPRAWVGVVSWAHVRRGVAGSFAQVCHGRRAPLERMREGDWLVYYSPTTEFRDHGTRGGAPLRSFTAIGRVLGTDGGEPDVYAVDMGGGFIPFRRNIAYLPVERVVPIATLAPKLHFVQNHRSWGALARRGIFEIDLHDLECIADAMSGSAARVQGVAGDGGGLATVLNVP